MVKSKKMSKTSIAVIAVAIMLVLSLVLGLTGAWFTDTASSASATTVTFGEVTLDVSDMDVDVYRANTKGTAITYSNYSSAATAVANNADVMPGDYLVINAGVAKATNSEDFWYKIAITVTPKTGSPELGTGATTAISTANNGLYCTTSDADATAFHETVIELLGSVYGNTYQTFAYDVTIAVKAIQYANVTAADAAKFFAATESGYQIVWAGTVNSHGGTGLLSA